MKKIREWTVVVDAKVSTMFTVWADSEEEAEREALVSADSDDLNDWVTEDIYVVSIMEED